MERDDDGNFLHRLTVFGSESPSKLHVGVVLLDLL